MSQAQRVESANDDEPNATDTGAKRPKATLRVENVEVAIWSNPSSNGTFYNATFSKKYKDSEGKTHNADSFGSTDILALQEAANQAYREIQKMRLKDREQSR